MSTMNFLKLKYCVDQTQNTCTTEIPTKYQLVPRLTVTTLMD